MKTIDKILEFLKRQGCCNAKTLANEFSLTTMAVRQHLLSLEQSGWVEYQDIKARVGRPTRHWQLSPQGHQRFADRHSNLLIQTFDAVESLFGEGGLQQVVKHREGLSFERYQQALRDCKNVHHKIETLAKLREQEGYMVQLERRDYGYLFIENHCPICRAAQHCPALCQSEINLFQTLLGAEHEIHRDEHIIKGERRCRYHITLNHPA